MGSDHDPLPGTAGWAINDAGGNQEVEKQTINRYYNLGLSYSSWTGNLGVSYAF